jgi:hypothetical protein
MAVVQMECEWEQKELDLLLEYAETNIPVDVRNSLMLSWAMEDILRKQMDSMQKEDPKGVE